MSNILRGHIFTLRYTLSTVCVHTDPYGQKNVNLQVNAHESQSLRLSTVAMVKGYLPSVGLRHPQCSLVMLLKPYTDLRLF